MEFISNNNKGMIWGLLQENNIFDGLETDKFDRIRTMFDDTIASININNKLMTLLEKNKLAMDILINKIKDEKTKPNNSIQMVYKAEDIQNRRNQDFNMKLKKQQNDMNLMMNPAKPKEVRFSDENSIDDKPIGDEMDRLIAERLATRERELEFPVITPETEQWLNNNHEVKIHVDNKTVPLNENKAIELYAETLKDNVSENSIFNKLKRKIEVTTNREIQYETSTESNSTLLHIEQEISILRENQDKIMNMCSQILEILQNNKTN
jgi:hypothetical protein